MTIRNDFYVMNDDYYKNGGIFKEGDTVELWIGRPEPLPWKSDYIENITLTQLYGNPYETELTDLEPASLSDINKDEYDSYFKINVDGKSEGREYLWLAVEGDLMDANGIPKGKVYGSSTAFIIFEDEDYEGESFDIEDLQYRDDFYLEDYIDMNDTINYESAAVVSRLYDSAFNGQGDKSATIQHYWQLVEDGLTNFNGVANEFIQSPIFQYFIATPSDSNTEYIEAVYKNVLGRDADTMGMNYWNTQLQMGVVDRGGVLLALSESAENISQY